MTKGKLVKALVLWSAVIVGLVIAIVGVTMICHGFSARQSPSRIETFVARSARSMAVPARARRMKNPIPNTAENLAEARAHWGPEPLSKGARYETGRNAEHDWRRTLL